MQQELGHSYGIEGFKGPRMLFLSIYMEVTSNTCRKCSWRVTLLRWNDGMCFRATHNSKAFNEAPQYYRGRP